MTTPLVEKSAARFGPVCVNNNQAIDAFYKAKAQENGPLSDNPGWVFFLSITTPLGNHSRARIDDLCLKPLQAAAVEYVERWSRAVPRGRGICWNVFADTSLFYVEAYKSTSFDSYVSCSETVMSSASSLYFELVKYLKKHPKSALISYNLAPIFLEINAPAYVGDESGSESESESDTETAGAN